MIQFRSVSKSYRGTSVLEDVSFDCPEGRVTGLFGPNGAGKSTLLRIMCNLTQATTGEVLLGGRRYRDLVQPATSVGVSLDASTLHPGRTGLETLRLTAILSGQQRDRADMLLELVGLGREGDKRVKNYSLGMRQRLGIAVALMGRPQMLVLDEPVNGLDPEGINWMRSVVRQFAEDGGTVLMSSHLLGEAQRSVDQFVILNHGRVSTQGSRESMTSDRATIVRGGHHAALIAVLQHSRFAFTDLGDHVRIQATPLAVGEFIAQRQIVVVELKAEDGPDLERLFFQATRAANPQALR